MLDFDRRRMDGSEMSQRELERSYMQAMLGGYSEQTSDLREIIAIEARDDVGDMTVDLTEVGKQISDIDAKRKIREDQNPIVAPESHAEQAQVRVQLRKQRAESAREYEYAAGLAGKASYWRDPVGSHRDGAVGGDVDRYADPYVLARKQRLQDNPRHAPIGPDGGEETFEASIAHIARMKEIAAEHEESPLRVLEEENRLRQALRDTMPKKQGQAFVKSLSRMPSRMIKYPGAAVKTSQEIALKYMTRDNQISLEALRMAGKSRHLRNDYSLKKWAARIPATEYRGYQVAQDREDEYIFDAQEKAYLLNVQAL